MVFTSLGLYQVAWVGQESNTGPFWPLVLYGFLVTWSLNWTLHPTPYIPRSPPQTPLMGLWGFVNSSGQVHRIRHSAMISFSSFAHPLTISRKEFFFFSLSSAFGICLVVSVDLLLTISQATMEYSQYSHYSNYSHFSFYSHYSQYLHYTQYSHYSQYYLAHIVSTNIYSDNSTKNKKSI